MSKILDEMREIAEGNNAEATQKTLLRLLISWGLDITQEITKQSKDISDIKETVSQNSDDIAHIKKAVDGNTINVKEHQDKIEVVEKNIFIKTGVYMQKKPIVGIMLATMIVLLVLHSLGIIVDIKNIIEEIADFLKILFIA